MNKKEFAYSVGITPFELDSILLSTSFDIIGWAKSKIKDNSYVLLSDEVELGSFYEDITFSEMKGIIDTYSISKHPDFYNVSEEIAEKVNSMRNVNYVSLLYTDDEILYFINCSSNSSDENVHSLGIIRFSEKDVDADLVRKKLRHNSHLSILESVFRVYSDVLSVNSV